MTSSDFQYPLRPRGALELFDVSLKLYKKYFWLLLGVTVLIRVFVDIIRYPLLKLVPAITSDSTGKIAVSYFIVLFILFFFFPFLFSAIGCCLEKALAGRSASIRGYFKYALPRYKVLFLSQCVSLGLAIVLGALMTIVSAVVILLIRQSITFNALAIPTIPLVVACICCWMYLFGLITFIPVLTCMEYQTTSLFKIVRRSSQLCWSGVKKLTALVTTAVLGVVAGFFILAVIAMVVTLLLTVKDLTPSLASAPKPTRMMGYEIMSLFIIITTLWLPLYLMMIGTFYIDMRIRKEAFDLEWAAREQPTELGF